MEFNNQDSTNAKSVNLNALSEVNPSESNSIQIPKIELPKGGGALRGIDEKFEVNPANGTASFSIPLPATPARNNLSPQLNLSYNSGAGNGAFGLGWSLSLLSIQLQTNRALPKYSHASEEDTFTLSGLEDLVPFLVRDEEGWRERQYSSVETGDYVVKRYRPRIEGNFTRIEKISHPEHGVFWKITTAENVTTIFWQVFRG